MVALSHSVSDARSHRLGGRVRKILSHETEAHKILYEDPSPDSGYLIIPDMKWDLRTVGSLYLVALVHTTDIRSLRSLRGHHLPLLKSIRREAAQVAKERWNIPYEGLRLFVHYQPSYCEHHPERYWSSL